MWHLCGNSVMLSEEPVAPIHVWVDCGDKFSCPHTQLHARWTPA